MSHVRESDSVETQEAASSVSMLQVVSSILASFFGVQSSRNRKRDFQSGKAKHFIAVGIVLTGVWYFAIYLVVTLILNNAR